MSGDHLWSALLGDFPPFGVPFLPPDQDRPDQVARRPSRHREVQHLGSEHERPLTRLTPEVCFPETEGWPIMGSPARFFACHQKQPTLCCRFWIKTPRSCTRSTDNRATTKYRYWDAFFLPVVWAGEKHGALP